jgi:hypothetical protein
VNQGKDIRVTGTIPATLSDFKIDPPSLLSMAVKNDMPVRVDKPAEGLLRGPGTAVFTTS